MASNKKQNKKPVKSGVKSKKTLLQRLDSQDWKYILGVLALTFIAFIPALTNDFVNWDDEYNLGNNANTALLSWDNIVKIFSEPVIGNYNPLPILTFAIERALFGLNPTVYHVNNVLLHLICVFFVYRIFRSLDLNALASGAGALLFGIHPMRVESVAWVTERKDVLFGAFFLAALWFYIQYVRTGYVRKYFYLAMGLFFIALFAKIQAVSLPLTMLLVDYYFRRPLQIKLVIEKWAFFLLSLLIGLVGIYFLKDQGSINDTTTYSLIDRLFIGGYSLGIYLAKFIFPYIMSPLYPYPAQLPTEVYIIGPIAALGIVAFSYLAFKKDWRPYLFGILFFLFNVMFVLQVVGAGQGFLADRFTYIPYAGLMFMVAYALQWVLKEKPETGKIGLYGLGGLMILYMFMTWNQNKIWKNSDTLWTHVLQYYDKTPLPFRNRANYRRDEGRTEEALADYNSAITLKPDGALYNSRAKLYFNQKKFDIALEDYNRAIEMDSTEGEYYINRGAVYALTNNLPRALEDFNKGLELRPDHANGYKNRSLIYQSFGQWENAISDITKYLSMHPEDADLWYERGRINNVLNKGAEALPDLDRAIQLNSKQGLYYYEKMKSFLLMGQKANALQVYGTVKQFGVPIEPEVQARLNE
jgi:tetratricopeptide (TPR) repeat protein